MIGVQGIHHITAIGSDPQALVTFYSKVLGLRLVKKTVNQDDVSAYHLFFGDRFGEPGMDLTFFVFSPLMQGVSGLGLVTQIDFSVPEESLVFWEERLKQFKVNHEAISQDVFGRNRIVFYNLDKLKLAFVGDAPIDSHIKTDRIWVTPEISRSFAIRSFSGATLSVAAPELVEPVLTHVLGYEPKAVVGQNTFFTLKTNSTRARHLVVEAQPDLDAGFNANGTVHHIAFSVESEAEQAKIRKNVIALGLHPTPVIDRYYFKSVYFRTPAGILFEIATKGPGFLVDQNEAELGTTLSLPPFLEAKRTFIEAGLKPISMEKI